MSYVVGARCRNCDTPMCVDIPKGVTKTTGLKKIVCPHCGVEGMVQFDPYKNCP